MAKVRPEQLPAKLKQSLAPVYLVFGDEALLTQEASDEVRRAARDQGYIERELYHVDNSFDWNELLASANSLSLFADRKIIELRIGNGKPGKEGSKALIEYLSNPPEDTVLLIITPKLDGNTQKTKWFKAIDSAGVLVQVWPVDAQQLPRWIGQRLSQAGLSADSQAIDVLASRVEGNLLAAAQEIEKLKLLATGSVIDAEQMAAAVANSARYDVFGLVDKCLNGDATAAIHTLHGLKAEGTDATVVLWALAREIRAMAAIAEAVDLGQNFSWAAKQNGVWEKRQPQVKAALSRLRLAQLQLLLRKANGIDKAVKGMRRANPWDELMDLILNLCGTFSLSPGVQKLALAGH
jgi:DNA polymerase-3 subunit delta